ncbi:MAG TPA: chemotaxis protein CheW [Pseudolabrys sp.]|jgi:purine-binding chemotaxis protein CheW|nr:chemotaxis protein CheW [Pseudolabrys sp.]
MTQKADHSFNEYVTALIGGQLFGLPILRVQDVFAPERLTSVPLSPPEVAGVLNLRGRIVTLIDMRCRLGLGSRENGQQWMAIGVESRGESYGLLIDSVGEVLKLDNQSWEPNPSNLDARLASVSTGIYRLDSQLLMVLDVDRVLDITVKAVAA